MGKGEGEGRTEAELAQYAQEENDVSRRTEEDCRSPASAVGEGEGGSEVVSIETRPGTRPPRRLPRRGSQAPCNRLSNVSSNVFEAFLIKFEQLKIPRTMRKLAFCLISLNFGFSIATAKIEVSGGKRPT